MNSLFQLSLYRFPASKLSLPSLLVVLFFLFLRKFTGKNLPLVSYFGESKFCWQSAEIRLPYHLAFIYATHFFLSNAFISNARLNWQKIKQMLSNTQRLNFLYLKIIGFHHPRYQPKIIDDILKNVKITCGSALMKLYDYVMTLKMRLKIKK